MFGEMMIRSALWSSFGLRRLIDEIDRARAGVYVCKWS